MNVFNNLAAQGAAEFVLNLRKIRQLSVIP